MREFDDKSHQLRKRSIEDKVPRGIWELETVRINGKDLKVEWGEIIRSSYKK